MKQIGGYFPRINLPSSPNGFLESLTPQGGDLQYFMSGRCGIYHVLSDYKKRDSKQVAYVPLYTCETVLAPFHKAGYELIFYDFDQNMAPIFDPSVLDRISLISICGYYGFSTYDRSFVAECSRRGICVLEDVTHSVFSSDGIDPHCDYIAGSFRKWIGVSCGGFAIKRYGSFFEKPMPFQPEHVTWRKECLSLKENWDAYSSQKQQELSSLGTELFWKSEMQLRQIFDSYGSDQESIQILKYYPFQELCQKRRTNYQYLLDHLQPSDSWEPVFQYLPDGTVPSHFTLYARDRKALQEKLADSKIGCTVYWPVGPLVHLGEHPQTQYIYNHVCSLPCDQRYGEEEMQRICDVLNQ